jgi:hypothetical protein
MKLLAPTGDTRLVAARSDCDKARRLALQTPRTLVEWVEVSEKGWYK